MNKTIWILGFLLFSILILTFSPVFNIDDSTNAILTLLIGAIFVFLHGSKAMGWRNILAFIVITFVISFISEATGVATGLIFGNYYYTDNLGPKIFGVPPMIQVAYIAMGYASLTIARILLDFIGTNLKKWSSILAVSLIGSFIMVSWDVVMDPYQSTYSGDWIWPNGGPYFGIALHNYVGWFATVFIFMLAYQAFARMYEEKVDKTIAKSNFFWSMPTLYYGLIALGMVVVPIIGGVSLPYAQPNNYSGTLTQLTHSISLITFFVMGTPVAMVLTKLFLIKSAITTSGKE